MADIKFDDGLAKARGMGITAMFLVVSVVIMVAILLVRFIPVYLEYFTVKQSLSSLEEEPALYRKTAGEIKTLLYNRLSINSVEQLGRRDIKVSKSENYLNVGVKYQVRKHLLANIDIVFNFDDSIEVALISE